MTMLTVVGSLLLLANGYLLAWGGTNALNYADDRSGMTDEQALSTRRMGQILRIGGWIAVVAGLSVLMSVP